MFIHSFVQVEMQGLTGIIKFDHQGFRTDFSLDVIELSSAGLKKVGVWSSTRGVNFTRTYGDHQREIVENLRNKTLTVTTIFVSFELECLNKNTVFEFSFFQNNPLRGWPVVADVSETPSLREVQSIGKITFCS